MTGGAAGSGTDREGEALGDPDGDGPPPALGASPEQAAARRATSTAGSAPRTVMRSMPIIARPVTPRPIIPFRHPLREVRVRVPASKSIANRELVLSAIADGPSRLEMGPLDPGDDVRAMRQALASLGYQIEWDQTFQVTIRGAETIPHAI